ncbi:MAG: PQQ-dependent sugar dehydrogenase [Burkholderiaceae bacterium]
MAHAMGGSLVLGGMLLLAGCGLRSEPPALEGARIAITVEDVVQLPASREGAPRARVNFLSSAPGQAHRLFVADMSGPIYIVESGQLREEPFLDLRVARKGRFTNAHLFEQGLSSFAFHPDFARSGQRGFGKLYTFSTEDAGNTVATFRSRVAQTDSGHHDVIIEWTVDAQDGNKVDAGSAREVMRIAHPRHDHVGGQLAFNPNARPGEADYGKLYIGVGDGGNTVPRNAQVDEWRTAQDLRLPLGKILRIDPLAEGALPYAVPPDNPFAGDAKAIPEIWAYGLRNPQRFSWDTGAEHKMLIADIGQAQLEEIDVGKAGANYGWSEREAGRTVSHGSETERLGLPLHDFLRGYTYPAIAYGHHLGLAVTGGFVYRGTAIPELVGMYIFGDGASGRIFLADVSSLHNGHQATFYEMPLRHQGKPRTLKQIVNAPRADLRFGSDDEGNIYVLTKQDGVVRRLTGTVAAENAIWPVEYPLEPIDSDSAWTRFVGRLSATVRDLSDSAKRVGASER